MKYAIPIFSAMLLLAAGCAGPSHRAGTITNQELLKTTRSWDGHPLPPYPKGQPEVSVRKIIIPPKTRLPLHKHPVINAGVLLRGRLTVVKENGETLHLSAGDPISEVIGTWHYGINPGRTPAEILIVYAGVQGTPTSIPAPSGK